MSADVCGNTRPGRNFLYLKSTVSMCSPAVISHSFFWGGRYTGSTVSNVKVNF